MFILKRSFKEKNNRTFFVYVKKLRTMIFISLENSIIVIQRQIIICAIIANIANDHCEYGEWNLLLPGIGTWIYLINHCKLTRRRKSNSFDFTVTTLWLRCSSSSDFTQKSKKTKFIWLHITTSKHFLFFSIALQ